MFVTVSPHKALEYFEARLEFTIGPIDLKEKSKRDKVNIVDVRSEEDYRQGHIPGAINLPWEKWETLEGLSHDKANVVYCYSMSCLLSARACKEFAENDYPVMELIGGFEEWKRNKLPIEK